MIENFNIRLSGCFAGPLPRSSPKKEEHERKQYVEPGKEPSSYCPGNETGSSPGNRGDSAMSFAERCAQDGPTGEPRYDACFNRGHFCLPNVQIPLATKSDLFNGEPKASVRAANADACGSPLNLQTSD